MISALVLAVGAPALLGLALVLRRRQREGEERAARTLGQLRRRHAALADRRAALALDLASLFRRPPAQP